MQERLSNTRIYMQAVAHLQNQGTLEIRPNILGWAVALISLLFWTFLTLGLVNYLAFINSGIEIKKLAEAVSSGKQNEILPTLKKAVVPVGIERWLSFNNSAQADLLYKHLSGLLDIQTFFDVNEFKMAQDSFEKNSRDLLVNENDQATKLNLISEDLTEAIKTNELNLQNAPALQTLLEERQSLTRRYQAIQHRLYSFFGFAYQQENLKSLDFYQEGVLKGLPLVSGLEDKIADLQILAAQIEKNGGKVSIEEGRDAHQFFVERLESLQDESFTLFMQLQSLEHKEAEVKVVQKKTEDALRILGEKMKLEINNFILIEATAHHNRSFKTLFY